jgi:catechol 2,3-dioxygenase-like lactoylglutathione lyase family enzyme
VASSVQLPAPGQIFLDHVGWMVPDMERAAEAFERLGFPLTPYSVHEDRDPATGAMTPVGTANRLAMLRCGYLELLTLSGGVDSPITRHMKAAMTRFVGVHLLAFAVDDAAQTATQIEARNFTLQPTVHLRRRVEAEDGVEVELAFTVARAGFEHFPEARVQILKHHTPEHLWQKRYLPRENGITGLLEAFIVTTNPREAAARFARFLGKPIDGLASPLAVRLDRGALRFVDTRGAAEHFGRVSRPPVPCVGAITLTSSDLERTRNFLLSQGLRPGALDPNHLLVDESEAMGVHLIIVAEQGTGLLGSSG